LRADGGVGDGDAQIRFEAGGDGLFDLLGDGLLDANVGVRGGRFSRGTWVKSTTVIGLAGDDPTDDSTTGPGDGETDFGEIVVAFDTATLSRVPFASEEGTSSAIGWKGEEPKPPRDAELEERPVRSMIAGDGETDNASDAVDEPIPAIQVKGLDSA
jgi:hypothetical protein